MAEIGTKERPRISGNKTATVEGVVAYLVDNWLAPAPTDIPGVAEGVDLTPDDARELVTAESEREFVEKSIRVFGSHANYVGDQIAERRDFIYRPDSDETVWDYDEDDDDDD